MRTPLPMLAAAIVAVPNAAGEPFTIVALPDTQNYVDVNRPSTNFQFFLDQTAWVVEHINAGNEMNIVFVTHLGDIVQRGHRAAEWAKADQAMSALQSVVPWSVVPGNHDWNITGDKTSGIENYLATFPPDRFERERWYAGTSENDLNRAQVIETDGRDFLHIAIEWNPPSISGGERTALGWAQAILDAHPAKPAIITTHEHVDNDPPGRDPIGQRIWDELIRHNPQVFLVLNGHFCGASAGRPPGVYHQASTNDAGLPVYEVLQDFQCEPNGGNGWLRLIEIDEAADRIRFRTYSPALGTFRDDPSAGAFAYEFTVPVDFDVRFACSPADLYGDGVLNGRDILRFIELLASDPRSADINSDRSADIFDLLQFQRTIDEGCP